MSTNDRDEAIKAARDLQGEFTAQGRLFAVAVLEALIGYADAELIAPAAVTYDEAPDAPPPPEPERKRKERTKPAASEHRHVYGDDGRCTACGEQRKRAPRGSGGAKDAPPPVEPESHPLPFVEAAPAPAPAPVPPPVPVEARPAPVLLVHMRTAAGAAACGADLTKPTNVTSSDAGAVRCNACRVEMGLL